MKKRVLSALLALVLVTSSVPTQVFATDAPAAVTQQSTIGTQDMEGGTQDDLQSTPQDDLQSTQQDDVQSAPQDDVQSTPQDDLQSTPQDDLQSTPQDDLQSTPQDDVQSAPQGSAQNGAQPALLANGGSTYLDEDGEMQQTPGAVELVNNTTTTLTSGWYLVEGTVSVPDNIMKVTGDTYLILADGAHLEAKLGIQVASGSRLTITAQSADKDTMGSLTVDYPYDPDVPVGCCGIGGAGSTVAIWGGNITSVADTIGIGGENSTVLIRGGVVSASSTRTDSTSDYAIGGSGSTVTISGGRVTTASSNYNGFDIGCSRLSTDKPDGSNGNALLCAGFFSIPVALESLDYISANRDGSPERVYGEVTLGDNLTIAEGKTLTIPAGTKLIVPESVTLTNNGTIKVEVGGRYTGAETSPNPVSYETVNYLDENGEIRTKRADEVTLVTSSTAALNDEDGGWYLVSGSVFWKTRLTASGNVTLILEDRAYLGAIQGIQVASGSSLTITAQSADAGKMGRLTATGSDLYPGIGGDGDRFDGSITINGGEITASAENGAGIGGVAQNGGSTPGKGSITINGGIVEATGGKWAAGIGIGGSNGSSVAITINGGEVTATGGEDGGAGIGTRENSPSKFSITIKGGTVQATGITRGAGIGSGGYVQQTNENTIEISGGVIWAKGAEGADAIGTGDDDSSGAVFSTGEDGHAVIYAASITGSEDATGWNCIWFDENSGSVYGDVTLDDDLTVEVGQPLTIEPGATLTVPADKTLTNNGGIQVELGGRYVGAQPANNPVAYWIGWDADTDGEAEESAYLDYNVTPNYSGTEPVKETDAQYTYTFRGWDPQIAPATGSVLYTAQFDTKVNRYTVTLPKSPVGYTLIPDSGATLDYGTDFTFTLTLAPGYSMTENFAVKANGEKLTAVAGAYTVKIVEDTTITVEGVADVTAPTFDGVIAGGSYYTTRQVTVNDPNLDTVTLNGKPVTSPVTLAGDTDKVYILTATDKAGNRAEITVTMQPIASLALPDTVTPADKSKLETLQQTVETLLGDEHLTDTEREKLKDTLEQVSTALASLERVEGVQGAVDALPDTVEPDDLETVEKIEAAKEQFDQLTDHEKELLGDTVGKKLEALLNAAGTYRILSGDGNSWTQGGVDGLTITANGAPERLIDLLLDGSSIDKAQITIQKGSTIVTLKPAYLDTLAAGTHTLTFVYENGRVAANFIVAAAQSQTQTGQTNTSTAAQSQQQTDKTDTDAAVIPQTGDTGNPVLWGLLAVLSLGALAGLFVWQHRKKRIDFQGK